MDAWPGFSSEPSRLWCSRWATTSPPGRTEWRPLVSSATGYFLCRSRIQARRSLDNAEKEPALSLSLLGGWRLSCHHRPLCSLDKVVCCDNKWVKIWSGQSWTKIKAANSFLCIVWMNLWEKKLDFGLSCSQIEYWIIYYLLKYALNLVHKFYNGFGQSIAPCVKSCKR